MNRADRAGDCNRGEPFLKQLHYVVVGLVYCYAQARLLDRTVIRLRNRLLDDSPIEILREETDRSQ